MKQRNKPEMQRNNSLQTKSSFLLIAILIGWFAGSSVAAGRATGTAEEEVRRVSGEEVQAFLRNDPKAMAQLWSDDLVVTNPLNRFVNKLDVLGMMQSGFLVITSYDRRIEYARVYGNTVVLAGSETVAWGGRMPNAGKTQQLRFTAVWMKQDGRWQEVARHANIVPQPETAISKTHATQMAASACDLQANQNLTGPKDTL